MFHVEHSVRITKRSDNMKGAESAMRQDVREKLYRFAQLLHDENARYNLTGLKSLEEIYSVLVEGSLVPVRGLDVPRGTRCADIGSGAGIPGMPIAIAYPQIECVLIESNEKKAGFIAMASNALGLSNVAVWCSRAEDVCAEECGRASFDIVVSRAMGFVYEVLELGLPLVRVGGFLYVYSRLRAESLDPSLGGHIETLGGVVRLDAARGLPDVRAGLLVKKIAHTPMEFPRRYPIIKRESKKLEKRMNAGAR